MIQPTQLLSGMWQNLFSVICTFFYMRLEMLKNVIQGRTIHHIESIGIRLIITLEKRAEPAIG